MTLTEEIAKLEADCQKKREKILKKHNQPHMPVNLEDRFGNPVSPEHAKWLASVRERISTLKEPEKPKAKRGRPPKAKPEPVLENVVVEPKKKGRPAKAKPEIQPKEPKKLGRPPKAKPENAPEKKSVGRPKTKPEVEKRAKRGRPPKAKPEPIPEPPRPEPVAPKNNIIFLSDIDGKRPKENT